MDKPLPRLPDHFIPVRPTSTVPQSWTWPFSQKSTGYHFGALCCTLTCAAVLLINLIVTIWGTQTYGAQGGLGTIQQGSCSETKDLAFWLHLAINGLSTTLLGASNYTMQCLSSPTRRDIDKCHRLGTWMDIGIPSVRNLRRIPRSRSVLWWLLAVSSIPLHLLFNSAVFSTLHANDIDVTVVTNDFMDAGTLNQTDTLLYGIPFQDLKENASTIQNMSNKDCLIAYAVPFVSNRANVMLVSSQKSTNNSFVVDNMTISTSQYPSADYDWICQENTENPEDRGTPLSKCNLRQAAANASSWYFHQNNVQYCLSQRVEEHCTVQFSSTIMAIVVICNLLKLIVMTAVVWRQDWKPLVTLGDAIASFIEDPDLTTKGHCLAWRKAFNSRGDPRSKIGAPVLCYGDKGSWDPKPKIWAPLRPFWFTAASRRRWFLCNGLAFTTLAVVFTLLNIGLNNESITSTQLSYLWSMGFGTVTGESMIPLFEFSTGTGGIITAILIANSPQLLLSFIYLTYNALFTSMLLANEWNGFTHNRKTLRVTDPSAAQRSTYWLQLPYRYSIPLLLTSGTLHWLVSQSIFLARVNVYDVNGNYSPLEDLSTLGYSCIAIIFVIALGCLFIFTSLACGFRRYGAGIPVAGSCSAAISAACHPPAADTKASLKPLLWGVVDKGEKGDGIMRVGHCSFTSFEVEAPLEGRLYE